MLRLVVFVTKAIIKHEALTVSNEETFLQYILSEAKASDLSDVKASELQENHEEMFPLYSIHSAQHACLWKIQITQRKG